MHTLSAKDLHNRFIDGTFSATQIVEYFLDRIERYNPKIGAFLTVLSERSRKKASELDDKRAAGKPLGKLAGVPIAIKDNIHIEGEITTCGSQFLKNYRAPFAATAVRLLEEADAILIGKTNLDEFAMGSSTENSSFQLTNNPWDLSMIPGGSSGGSAAAVAARLVPLSLGSDTGGSIRQPAALCGISGYKPTYGKVSRFGLVAFASSLDQIGPFAHKAEDLAFVMEVLGVHCEKDSTSIPLTEQAIPLAKDFQDLTIGVPFHFLENLDEAPRALFEQALAKAKSLGATVVEVNLDLLQYSIAVYYILATAEASTNLARFDGVRYGKRSDRAKTLEQVYDYSKQEGFGPEVKRRIMLGTYVLSAGYQDAYYKKAQSVRTLIMNQYKEAWKTCDLIAMPTTSGTAFAKGSVQDPLKMYLQDIYTIGANLAGIPSASIPIGFLEGLPYGMQLCGPQKADASVCSAASLLSKEIDAENLMPTQFQE